MIRGLPRGTITTALVLLAGLCLTTLFTPQFLTQVRDELLWREHSAAPPLASLNAYLRGCSTCFYRRQGTGALAEAGKSAGLLAWLDTIYLYGRSTTDVDRWQVRGQTTGGAFSPDGGRVVTTGNGIGSVWDATSGKREYVVSPFPLSSSYRMSQEGRDDRLPLAAFFGDGRRLASLSAPGHVVLWTADTGGKLQTIATGIRDGASLTASGRVLAFVHDAKAATVLDVTTGKL